MYKQLGVFSNNSQAYNEEFSTLAKGSSILYNVGQVGDDIFHWQVLIIHPVGSPYSKELSFIVIHFPLDSISVRVLQVQLEILDDLYLSRSIDERDHHAEALTHVVKCSCSENELLAFGSHDPRRDKRSQCSLREMVRIAVFEI